MIVDRQFHDQSQLTTRRKNGSAARLRLMTDLVGRTIVSADSPTHRRPTVTPSSSALMQTRSPQPNCSRLYSQPTPSHTQSKPSSGSTLSASVRNEIADGRTADVRSDQLRRHRGLSTNSSSSRRTRRRLSLRARLSSAHSSQQRGHGEHSRRRKERGSATEVTDGKPSVGRGARRLSSGDRSRAVEPCPGGSFAGLLDGCREDHQCTRLECTRIGRHEHRVGGSGDPAIEFVEQLAQRVSPLSDQHQTWPGKPGGRAARRGRTERCAVGQPGFEGRRYGRLFVRTGWAEGLRHGGRSTRRLRRRLRHRWREFGNARSRRLRALPCCCIGGGLDHGRCGGRWRGLLPLIAARSR